MLKKPYPFVIIISTEFTQIYRSILEIMSWPGSGQGNQNHFPKGKIVFAELISVSFFFSFALDVWRKVQILCNLRESNFSEFTFGDA